MQLCLAKVHPVLFFDVGYYYFYFLFEGKIELRTCLYTLNKKNSPLKFYSCVWHLQLESVTNSNDK